MISDLWDIKNYDKMVMKLRLLLTCIIFSMLGCSDDNNGNAENNIIGTWSLTKFEAGFSPFQDFNKGVVVWIFQQNGMVNITVDDSVLSIPIKPTGSYVYSLIGSKITIGDDEYDFQFTNGLLIISDNPSANGFRAEFSKN